MSAEGFDLREGTQGLGRGRESYGDDPRDVTHVAIPLRVTGRSADEAVARAQEVGARCSAALEGMEGVVWVRSQGEAAYALLANLHTALSQLTPAERTIVLLAAPARAELAALLSPPNG